MVHFRTDIGATNPNASPSNDTYNQEIDVDVLIVGAGFGGVYLLHRLRDELGFNCKIYEAGTNLGGIWHWNCYPGARVDTPVPIYEYSLEKVWKVSHVTHPLYTSNHTHANTAPTVPHPLTPPQGWTWKYKYPDYQELRDYFDHVEKQLDIKKDTAFNTRVVGAQYNNATHKWDIKTEDGRTAHARFFINAIGFAAKRHFPDWKGLDSFKGDMYHSSFWPQEGVDVKGKRVAVIGTGSTGIQIAQETSKEAASVTVFQRTPNLCLPMGQRKLTEQEQQDAKARYPDIYRHRLTTFAGFPFDFSEKNTFDDDEQQREAFFEQLWANAGFEFWLATYKDMLFDKKANDQAYAFWLKKTRARISDPEKRDILAPNEAPHAWGTKRPSLEQDFYEQMDKPQNHVVDIKANPIVEVKENGIVTQDGQMREFDVIALATGFDSVTGGMKNMGLRDEEGVLLSEKWKTGTWSYLGMTCNGYPVCRLTSSIRPSHYPSPSSIPHQCRTYKTDADCTRTCSSSTAPKARQPSATDPRASRSKATGSSTPSPSARTKASPISTPQRTPRSSGGRRWSSSATRPVSYTHLTLPTKRIV